MGHRCFASLSDIAEPVDLAVIVLPAVACAGAMRECAAKGVKAAIVMSSGFGEAGRQDLQDELLMAARSTGIRFVGPNTAGFVSMESALVASISMVCAMNPLRAGGVAFVTQSGAMGGSCWAARWSKEWASATGSRSATRPTWTLPTTSKRWQTTRACMSSRCFLKACAMAPDSFAPAKLRRAQASRSSSTRAAPPRSAPRRPRRTLGALAGSHKVFSAMCRQHGLIQVDDIADLLPLARTFAWTAERMRLHDVRGRRVGIVSASGGICGVAADECERFGLSVPELPQATQDTIRGFVPSFASVRNPIDVTGQIRASATGYQDTRSCCAGRSS